MDRPIIGFHSDAQGRAARIGTLLDCVRCDRREIPEGHAPHRRTRTFDRSSAPEALLGRHASGAGVWARIHVLRGRLAYEVHEPYGTREVLDPETPGTVLPEVEHHVTPLGEVSFFVEFWRAGGDTL